MGQLETIAPVGSPARDRAWRLPYGRRRARSTSPARGIALDVPHGGQQVLVALHG